MFGQDGSTDLPVELILTIFIYLPLKNMAVVALVCRAFDSYSNDNELWRQHFRHYAPAAYMRLFKQNNVNYKAEYRKLSALRFFQVIDDLPYQINPRRKHLDYHALLSEHRIGMAELRGARVTQDNRVNAGALRSKFLCNVPKEVYTGILSKATALVQDFTHKVLFNYDDGSTLCATVIVGNDIYTVNLGDSAAYVAVLDESNKVVQFLRLNTLLHRGSESAERKRILKTGAYIEDNEYIVNDEYHALRLSRSLGYSSYEGHGLSHEPDTYVNHVAINQKGKVFVIVACDGLTDRECLTTEDIKGLLEAHHEKPPNQIAVILAKEAILRDSRDNVSVLVTPLDENASRAKYMGVFDGSCNPYNSESLSEPASQLFGLVLQIKLNCAILYHSFAEGSLKNKLVSLTENVDQAYSYIYTIFDDFHRRGPIDISDKYYLFVKQVYIHYVRLLSDLVNALPSSEYDTDKIPCFAQCFARTKTFSAILLLPTILENYQRTHFPADCEDYLRHPQGLMKTFIKAVNNINRDNLEEVHAKLTRLFEASSFLYQVAGVIFTIRKNYDSKMPFTGYNDFIYSYNDDVPRSIITQLKQKVDSAFFSYPQKALIKLLNELLEKLKLENQNVSGIPYVGHFFQFVEGNDRLKWCLITAIHQVEKIHNELIKYEQNTNLKELPCLQ